MLFALLSRHADRTPHATALVSGDRRITYRALAEMAAALADRLAGDGVAAGEAVAVVLPNSVELVVALFAAWRRGAIVLPLGPELDDAAIQRALAETGARRVITDRPGAPRAARLTGQDRTWVVDAHALALAEPVAPEPDGPDAGHAGRALYLYTSGSEGHRRRVCRTQHNLISEATQFTTSAALTADDAILCLVPLYHSYGLGNGLLAALAVGAPLVLLAPYAASAGDGEGVELPFVARCREVIAIVRAAAIRVVLGVGYQYATLAQLQTEAGDLAGVRWCFSSGSRLDMATYGRFLARFARPIRQIYGSTETGTIAANLIEGPDFAPDRVGRCVTGVAVAVLDAHGGEVADGEIGELVVTSPVVPPGGYDGDPEATARAFAGGRYRTGDRGRRCADGALQVVERKPTFIETAGYKVDPAEIEAVLAGHPQVREVAVIGVASPELGQQPIAFVAVDDGCDEAALAAYCADRLAAHQRPAGFELRAALPRGPLGKILRDTLVRDRAANPAPGGAAPGSAAPGSAARADDRGARFAAELARCAGPRERRAAAEHWIRREVAEVLRLVPDQLAPHRPLQNLGFDSLSTVALHRRLEALTHHRLPITFIWDHPAIAALATAVLDQLGDAQLGDAGHRAPPAVDAGAPARGREPLAVIGIGCRFPGGVTSPETYWDLLWNGVDAISDVPADRWNPAELAPIVQPAVPPSRGGFLTGHDQLDAGFFGISPPEATAMDPQQRLLLEVTWEAIEDAGIAPEALRGSPTGVFTGIGVQDWSARTLFSSELAELGQYSASATAPSVAVGRVSYVLDLRGPSVAFDTACSSSLVALHYACQAVLAGECELALAGGVNVILEPNLSVALARAEMLAPDGRCKSFDAAANGYVRAEGCGVVVIKRLSAAVRDRDRIYAVIRGSAVTQDGRTHGLTAPSGRAQEQAIRAALAAAGVRPADVGYVEAHGTGTAIGDPIEAHALGAVLGEGRPADAPARIGSVKTNFGHTETAAGIAAFAKVALMLSRRAIPASLHFRTPNPRIDWDRLPLRVAATRQAWTVGEGERRIAGVTSAGFGGTNAHVVVEEPPEEPPALAQGGAASAARPAVILCLSARSEAALGELARRYERHLVTHPALALDDLAFTAAVGRGQFDHRAAIVIDAGDQARAQMIAALGALGRGARSAHVHRGQVRHGEVPRLAFVFTGQGAQRAGMGRALYAAEPVFRAALDECAAVFAADADGDAPALLDVMFDGGDALDATGWAQPALFALEAALIRLWASWGVTADVALGHSVGEFAAAHAGGALSLAAGLRLVAARGRLMQALPAGGTMIAVDADPEAAQAIVAGHGDRVALAAINGPRAVVLSGERAAVEAAAGALAAQSGGRTRQLRVSHAFHSALLDPMLDELEAAARTAPPAALQATLISNVTGAPFAPGTAPDAAYWRRHARAPVQFAAGLAALAQLRVDAVIELGPRPVLLALAREVLGDDGPALIASLQDGRPEPREILTALAAVWARGARVDWAAFHANRGAHKIALPTYPFERKRYWIERSAPGMPGAAGRSLHPLLGRAVASAAAIAQFEAQLSASVPAYLDDHRIHGLPVLPAVGYVELALAAARQLRGDQAPIDLTDVVFDRALVLPEAGARRVQLVVGEREADRLTFEVHSQDAGGAASGMASGAAGGAAGGAWTCHARGTIAVRATRPTDAAGGDDLATLRGGFGAAVDLAGYYETLAASGLDYGPGFRGLGRAWRSPARPGELLAEVALPADHVREASEHLIHPALLDACLHGIRAAQHGLGGAGAGDDTYLPVGIAGITLVRAGIAAAICHIRTVSGPDAASPVFDVTVWDHDGQLAVVVRGLSLLKVERGALRRLASADVRTWLYEVAWDKAPLAAAEHAPAGAEPGASIVGAWIVGAWIVIDDAGGVARALARRFAQRGQRAVIVPAGGPDAIARAIVETAGPVHGVIHLGALALAGGGEPDPVRFLDDQRTLCSSALAAIHALVAHAAPPPALYLVTRGAQRVVRGDLTAPAHAALWGLGRVLATEHPELRTRLVDRDPA
ncbi:MAG TPA: beta-ketoacyl synthase N-terminal-like domain-containing protein, partial [Kofleriaceae bacterium]|nr:beta-ketoacyl synthase N-terminal-like domain-containing protein [Kofleriaceae bacterium]